MSDLDTRPRSRCARARPAGLDRLLITARRVPLGKTTEVARALPDRQVRMIGAWCFLDHYGPEDLGDSPGMQVWAHPHTGLQTVSWLFEGEIEHRDSLGSQAMVRPGAAQSHDRRSRHRAQRDLAAGPAAAAARCAAVGRAARPRPGHGAAVRGVPGPARAGPGPAYAGACWSDGSPAWSRRPSVHTPLVRRRSEPGRRRGARPRGRPGLRARRTRGRRARSTVEDVRLGVDQLVYLGAGPRTGSGCRRRRAPG